MTKAYESEPTNPERTAKDGKVQTGSFGQHVRSLRKNAGMTLAEISEISGMSVSAISKIERDQISPTFFNLMRLAEGLDIHIADLVKMEEPDTAPSARLAVTRKSEQSFTEADQYSIASLCGNLQEKRMKPLINRVSPENPDHPVENIAHHGEEFVYVLEGTVEIRTDYYQTILLEQGDSIYFDSSMPHAYVSAGPEDAEVCVIWLPASSVDKTDVEKELKNAVRLRQPKSGKT